MEKIALVQDYLRRLYPNDVLRERSGVVEFGIKPSQIADILSIAQKKAPVK